MADKLNALAKAPVNALSNLYSAYQRRIGQPFQQAVRGGVRGYFGLPMMTDADALGREAYRQAEALGYTPGVGMPASAVRLAAEGLQALPSIAGDIGRVIAGMPTGAGAAQAEDFARYQRSIPPSDVSPLTAFHGTPHTFAAEEGAPLGRFRSEKIGTGERAQAYGYGLYFAESPGVAKEYRERLSTNVTVDGAKLQTIPSDSPMATAHNMTVRNIQSGMPAKEAIAATNKYWTDAANEMLEFSKSNPELIEMIKKESASRMEIANAAKSLKPESFYRDPGSLYTVDIPDSMVEKMLDWDKPLSQQPKSVRQFFEPLVAPIRKAEAQGSGPEWGDFAAPRDYDPLGSELMQLLGRSDQMSAASVLSGGTGGAASSAKLQAAGIPGIRYLDAGSRGSADGTRNIVVFPGEEDKVKILKRD